MERDEFKREGLEWIDIKYKDNQPVLDLFLDKTTGILAYLDEACKLPTGNDFTFFESIEKNLSKNDLFHTSRKNKYCFSIKHYASSVEYLCLTWVEKNKDTIPNNIECLLCNSTKILVQEVFTGKIH